MDTDSFIVYIKTDHVYKDVAKDAETRFHTSNYNQIDRYQKKKEEEESNWINER